MKRFGIHLLMAALLFSHAGRAVFGAENGALEFTEVYNLIKANASGVSETELNRAAVDGLLTLLGPKVALITNDPSTRTPADAGRVSKTTLHEDGIAYFRIGRVAEGLGEELNRGYRQLGSTNRLKGVVLDLRYSGGTDYSAAVAAADLFIAKAQPLLNWGNGAASSREKTNAIQLPVAILVNGATSGPAEALAAVLRGAGAGLILGGKTAGRATVAKDFPLKSGEVLRIATAPVTLGDGSSISTDGLKPDIDVMVNADDEREYYADAFYVVRRTNTLAGVNGSSSNLGTNGSRRTRFNEAELVREHREGQDRENPETARSRPAAPEAPLVNDPTLARALDLLKGLAVVRQSRS